MVPPHPGHQQAVSSVLYTTSRKHRLVTLRMGEINARNMFRWLKLLIKLSLLHLVGCLYYCIKSQACYKVWNAVIVWRVFAKLGTYPLKKGVKTCRTSWLWYKYYFQFLSFLFACIAVKFTKQLSQYNKHCKQIQNTRMFYALFLTVWFIQFDVFLFLLSDTSFFLVARLIHCLDFMSGMAKFISAPINHVFLPLKTTKKVFHSICSGFRYRNSLVTLDRQKHVHWRTNALHRQAQTEGSSCCRDGKFNNGDQFRIALPDMERVSIFKIQKVKHSDIHYVHMIWLLTMK